MIQARPVKALAPTQKAVGKGPVSRVTFQSSRPAARAVVVQAKFNYPDLTRSAVRSSLSYLDPPDVNKLWKEAHDPKLNTPTLEHIELQGLVSEPLYVESHKESGEDAQAYVWTKDSRLYITFRGTHGVEDIKADSDGLKTVAIAGEARVHQGFWKQFKSIESTLREQIEKHDSLIDIVFAGHSLGGGIAQIAAAYYGAMYPTKNIVCHTFGGPRAGNVAFTEWFANHVDSQTRVVNKNDPVPMVPQRSIWHHTAERCIVIDDACTTTVVEKDIPWYLRWLQTVRNVDFRGLIKDHDILIYIDRLDKLAKSEIDVARPPTAA